MELNLSHFNNEQLCKVWIFKFFIQISLKISFLLVTEFLIFYHFYDLWLFHVSYHHILLPTILEKWSQLIPDHIVTPVSQRSPISILYQLRIFFWDYKHSLCLILSIIVVVFNQIVLLLWVVTIGKIYFGVFLVNIGTNNTIQY